jgi:hypothetical protein
VRREKIFIIGISCGKVRRLIIFWNMIHVEDLERGETAFCNAETERLNQGKKPRIHTRERVQGLYGSYEGPD